MPLSSRQHIMLVAAAGTVLVAAGGLLGWRQWQSAQAASQQPAVPALSNVFVPDAVPATVAFDEAAWQAFRTERLGCPAEEPTVTVAFVGDVMLSRSVGASLRAIADYDAPFVGFKNWLRSADLAVANLETAITPGRAVKPLEMMFRADPESAGALARAGFDLVSLANNHTPNFGQQGLNDTFESLDIAGVRYVGAGRDDAEAYRPALLKANGLTFAFVAQNDSDVVPRSYGASAKRAGTALLDVERIKSSVAEARRQADVVVFLMHSGTEYTKVANARQRQYAHAAVDAGADLVIGHHAHVVQEMETYAGKPVLYGLGNFVFDQSWSRDTQEGLAVRAVWRGRTLMRLELEPLSIDAKYRPDFAGSAAAQRIVARLGVAATAETAWRWDELEHRLKPEGRAVIALAKGQSCRPSDVTATLGEATLSVVDGRAKVTRGEAVIWESPEDLWMDDAAVGENGGLPVASLTYWRQEEGGPRMHLGALSWSGGAVAWRPDQRPLEAPVCALSMVDLDGGSSSETIAVLGDYADGQACAGRAAAVLRERQGGFDVIPSSVAGRFDGLTVGVRQGRGFFQPHLIP